MAQHVGRLLWIALIVVCGGQALGDTTWTGGGDGSSWTDTGNWNNGLPNGQRRVFINGTSTVNIPATVNDIFTRFIIADAAGSDSVTVHMVGGSIRLDGGNDPQNFELGTLGRGVFHLSGGTFTVDESMRMAVDPAPATPSAALIVDGGTLNVGVRLYMGYAANSVTTVELSGTGAINSDQFFVGDGAGTQATLTVSGGTLTTGRLWAPTNQDAVGATGHIQLNGGTIIAQDFSLTNSTDLNIHGSMDIRAGTLIVTGDVRTMLTDYVAQGFLTGYGFADTGHVLMTYNAGANTTTVTAEADVNCFVATAALPAGDMGVPYAAALQAAPGCSNVTWSLEEGYLPAGLTLDPSGQITGTPTVSGSSTFTVQMAATEATRSQTFTVKINPAFPLESACQTDVWIREYQPDLPAYEADRIRIFSAAASPDSYRRWGLVEFDLSRFRGMPIHGAALRLHQPGWAGSPMKQSAKLVPSQPSIATISWNQFIQSSYVGAQDFQQFGRFVLAGGTPAGYYYESASASAADLALLQADIDGDGKVTLLLLPDEDLAYQRDWGDGEYAGEDPVLVIDVGSSCMIATGQLPDATQARPYSFTLQTSPGCAAGNWEVVNCFLPPGLTLDAGSGLIHGMPAFAGYFSFTVQYTPTGGGAARQADLAITVDASPADLDRDGDVDAADFTAFSGSYTGPQAAVTCTPGEVTSDHVLLASSSETWVRPSDATGNYEDDNVQVFSAAAGNERIGLVEFDVRSLAGKTLRGAWLRMHEGLGGSNGMKASAAVIPSGIANLTYAGYQASKEAFKQPLEQLGRFDVAGLSAVEDSFKATPADLQAIAARAAGDGYFTMVIEADPNAAYARKWGDGVYGAKPELIIVVGACGIDTLSLPAANMGQPYSATLAASSDCTGTRVWSLAACDLPDGLSLNPSTGVISGSPKVGGVFPFQVQLTSAQGTRFQNLTLDVATGGPGDFDADGDVDLEDYHEFALAYTGVLGTRPFCGTVNINSTDTPLNVPDGGSVSSVIVVPPGITVGDLNVAVDVTHSYDVDVKIVLKSPAGTTVMLKDYGGIGAPILPVTYDDEGLPPAQPLSAFDGQSATGNWTLTVSDFDAVFMDYPVVNSWKLVFTGQ